MVFRKTFVPEECLPHGPITKKRISVSYFISEGRMIDQYYHQLVKNSETKNMQKMDNLEVADKLERNCICQRNPIYPFEDFKII